MPCIRQSQSCGSSSTELFLPLLGSHGVFALVDLHRKHNVGGRISNGLNFSAHTFRLPLDFDDCGHPANVATTTVPSKH